MRRRNGANSNAGIPTTTFGMLRVAAGRQFVLESDDHRLITYRISGQMQVQKDGKDVDLGSFAPGDQITVDSTEDEQGFYTATSVRWDKAGTPEQQNAARETWDLPRLDGQGPAAKGRTTSAADAAQPDDDRPILRRQSDSNSNDATPTPPPQANAPQQQAQTPPAATDDSVSDRPTTEMRPANAPRDPDDPGPPVLKRAGQAATPRSNTNTIATADDGAMPSVPQKRKLTIPYNPAQAAETVRPPAVLQNEPTEDPEIAKARAVAEQYLGTLPNFFCQQVTTRYESSNPKRGWDALDVVSADVAYENGHETYKNIKIGNRPVNKNMDDISGTRSTGEFSSILIDLLSPATGATFRRSGSDSIHTRPTWVYTFEVPRERSHWRIEAPSQLYYPSYKGSIWIDKQTGRILRMEQQARNMPVLFPFDTVETATDYDFVRLSTPTQYLLPVDAEVLSCVRGTSNCSRNRIEFRNYRKFGAETSITFDGKDPQ